MSHTGEEIVSSHPPVASQSDPLLAYYFFFPSQSKYSAVSISVAAIERSVTLTVQNARQIETSVTLQVLTGARHC